VNARIAATLCLAVLALAASGPARAVVASGESRAREADSLHTVAVRLLDRDDINARRRAIVLLEQATLLDPDEPGHELALARTYYRAGFIKLARQRFERVTRLSPTDANGRLGLGQVWRRDWLKFLDTTSLARSVENLSMACRLDPSLTEGWLLITPLLLEQGNLAAAVSAADHARESDPRRPETVLAAAYTHYRRGDVEFAERAFASAMPRLPWNVRERFHDIAPVASERDTMILNRLPVAEQAAFIERFWRENDPDLASEVNEARLEYWSRVAHAFFLFYDHRRREWDQRGEVFVRYGAPRKADYNPLDQPRYFAFNTGPAYPANTLVWDYPDLGMQVVMQDRLLSEYYLPIVNMFRDVDPSPHPDSLARRGDQLAVRGGRGVFPMLPPGARPLPTHAIVARFSGERGPRLLAQVEAPGGPADSLWAEWVVLDTSYAEVARARRALSPSACDALGRRVADFAGEVAPGRYLVGVTVHDGRGGRGVFRGEIDVPRARGLHISDVVVSCGAPYLEGGALPAAIRIEPNPESRVGPGEPLTAYFEVYGLAPGADGRSRFDYVYTVTSAERDERVWLQRLFAPRRDPPPISASREESQTGPLRRQFVSVPVQSLPPGRYRLEVRVRDLVTGADVMARAEFDRVGATGS
jgi:GWxTD domain-containing protein